MSAYPVVGAGGLVGQVIQSFHHTAVVQLVTDGQSKVGVTFGPDSSSPGTVDGQGPLELHDGRPGAAPHAAAQGRDDVHQRSRCRGLPAGHPRGQRASRSTRAAGASQETITVDPAADLGQLAYVDVVQWVPPP